MSFAAADYALPFPREHASVAPLVPAVARALTLLDRLARGREPMTLARLSSELALPKSSVHGLCTTLVSFGYLRRQADGSFLIGPRVMGLAEAFVAGTDVAQEFNALWGTSGIAPEETVLLSVLSGNEALYVAVRNSARPLGLAFNVGMRLPAYLSGSGKAMLAQLPAEEVRRRFTGQLSTRLTSKGPRDIESLAEGARADEEARLQHRRRSRARRRLFLRRRRCSAPRAMRSRRSPSASTRRSSAAIAACAIATPRSTLPAD